MKVYMGKGGAYVTFEKSATAGTYTVRLRTGAGETADKVVCFDYHMAVQYRKAFLKTARAKR